MPVNIANQRTSKRYELVRGLVVQHTEIEIQDVDTGEWRVAGRTTEETNLTKTEMAAALAEERDEIVTRLQADIDKVNAL